MTQHNGLPQALAAELDRRALLARTVVAGVGGATLLGASRASVAIAAPQKAEAVKNSLYAVQRTSTISFDPDKPGFATQALLVLYEGLTDVAIPADFALAKKQVDQEGLKVVPKLAASWSSTKDGKTWRFNLRPNAKSTFGNTLTSDDVVWSAAKWIGGKYVAAFLARLVGLTSPDQVKAAGPNAVTISLPAAPPNYFLSMLGLLWLPIYDSTEAKKHVTAADPFAQSWLGTTPAGFGPYRLVSNTDVGSQTLFAVNAGYYGKKPAIPNVRRSAIDENSTRLQLVLSGNADLADDLSALELETVAKSKTAEVTKYVTTRDAFLVMDNSVSPFDNPTIRKGIARAIPYDDIVKFVYRGRAQRWKTMIVPWFPGATDEFWKYETNISVAKSMLAPIKDVTLTLTYSVGTPAGEQTAILIQQGLRSAGINVQLEPLVPAIYQTKKGTGQLKFFITEQDSPAILSSLYNLQQLFTTTAVQKTLVKYKTPPELDAIVAKLTLEQDNKKRNALVRDAQRILVPDMPIIPLAYTGNEVANRKGLAGFTSHQLVFLNFQDLFYKK